MSNVSINISFASAAIAAAVLTQIAGAIDKAGGTVSAGSTTTSGKATDKKTEPAAPKYDLEQVKAIVTKVAGAYADADKGKAAARELFQPLGYKTSKEIKPEHFDQVYAAAEKALAEAAKEAEEV